MAKSLTFFSFSPCDRQIGPIKLNFRFAAAPKPISIQNSEMWNENMSGLVTTRQQHVDRLFIDHSIESNDGEQ